MNPNTSWAVALESLVLIKLRQLGGYGTSRQVAEAIGKPLNLVWPRFTALEKRGEIRDIGERIRAGRGRPQVVWYACDPDRHDYRQPKHNHTVMQPEAPRWFQNYGQ